MQNISVWNKNHKLNEELKMTENFSMNKMLSASFLSLALFFC